MDALTFREHPELRKPILVTAFLGWNDAAESATNAVRYLRRLPNTEPVADIDPEQFFVFTEQRPQIRLTSGRQREILWPTIDFTYSRLQTADIDLVVGLAAEPQLKWKHFADTVLTLARDLGVSELVTLGALLSDTPHTRPVPLTGIASDSERALALGFQPSNYEGPTGIVGVLNDACRRAGLPFVSLWANCPHYIGGIHNPRATQALLHKLNEIYSLGLRLDDLDARAQRYEVEVTNAIKDNPDVQEYVGRLEAAAEANETPPPAAELRSSDILEEIDRLLKRNEADDDPPSGTPPLEGG